jgi:hypothetical protein
MRFITLILFTCLLLSGCFGFGVEAREVPPGWRDSFTNGSSNAILYMFSIIAIAAGIALIVWTPFKQVGLFTVTMFGSIIVLTYVFALILSIMPWILAGAAFLVVAYGVYCVRKHNWDISDTLDDLGGKAEDKVKSEFSKVVKRDTNV